MSIHYLQGSQAYRDALKKALAAYNITEDDKAAYMNFAVAFSEGWEASKKNTTDILNSITGEDNGDE